MLSLHCNQFILNLIIGIWFLYSGFGDSTGEPTEAGLTTDAVYLYHWVKARSGNSLVCVWGHSLGSGCVKSPFFIDFCYVYYNFFFYKNKIIKPYIIYFQQFVQHVSFSIVFQLTLQWNYWSKVKINWFQCLFIVVLSLFMFVFRSCHCTA